MTEENSAFDATLDLAPAPGVASGESVIAVIGGGSQKQTCVEKLGNRHSIWSPDPANGKYWAKVKQRTEHIGQRTVELNFRRDSMRGTKFEGCLFMVILGEAQEVWAATKRGAKPCWIAARDLQAERHVLKLDINDEVDSWGDLVLAAAPTRDGSLSLPIHELTLIDSDWFLVSDVICRATSVSASAPPKKRFVYPLKDVPLINFVPQPKTLSLAQAEIWYRKSAALLPRCVNEHAHPVERVREMLALKNRMRDVAVRALIETTLRSEFVETHPLPVLEDLIPNHDQLSREALENVVRSAVQALSEPGDRHYSEFCGGMESHRVWSEVGHWEFNGSCWVQSNEDRANA